MLSGRLTTIRTGIVAVVYTVHPQCANPPQRRVHLAEIGVVGLVLLAQRRNRARLRPEPVARQHREQVMLLLRVVAIRRELLGELDHVAQHFHRDVPAGVEPVGDGLDDRRHALDGPVLANQHFHRSHAFLH